MEQQPTIDNLEHYLAEVVDQLGKLLVEGVSARQDPRRKNFYDVEHADRAFAIHLSPSIKPILTVASTGSDQVSKVAQCFSPLLRRFNAS
jgi:hypothetical protein